jgi:hypothetical protein
MTVTGFEFITALAAIITAFATFFTAYFMWKQNRTDIKVKVYREIPFPGSNFIFQALNKGHTQVTLTKLGFKFPDSTYHYYSGNPPFSNEPFFNGSLPIKKTISSEMVGAELCNNKLFKGTVKIRGFFEDTAERKYFGDPTEIDVDYFMEKFKSDIEDAIKRKKR